MSTNKILKTAKGYQASFIDTALPVPLPELNMDQVQDLAFLKGTNAGYVLNYLNYSVVQNKKRKFPFFVAANIDGKLFKTAERADRWRLDTRLDRKYQWGSELYAANKSDFDKGHMAKREDVQWGKTLTEAEAGAAGSFFYTNAVPQAANLNRRIWKSLEDYILKKETYKLGLKVSVFTGPVLNDDDPVFITPINGEEVRIPTLFWKVIYFRKDADQQLYRLGFLMGQEELLLNMAIVHPREVTSRGDDDVFMRFDKAETYQVSMETIEKLSALRFAPAHELYQDTRPIPLTRIIERVQVRGLDDESAAGPNFEIEGLVH